MNEQQFKALPLEQRKAHQERLQALGLYVGKPDGHWGEGTRTAFEGEAKQKAAGETAATAKEEKARTDSLKATELEIALANARAAGKKTDADVEATNAATEAARAKTARKEAYDKEASSGLGMATQTAAGAPAALTGVAAGRGMGMGINKLMDMSQESKNRTLAAAAQDRVAGLTTREGSRLGSALAGAMPSSNSVARVGGRMLPHAALGTFMAGKGGMMLAQEGEDDPFYPKMIDRGAGLGMIGAGTGIAERGITYGVAPGVAPDAKSIAIIESNQLRRNNTAPEPDKPDPKPGSRDALRADAKEIGVKGAYKMNKGQLSQALLKAGGKAPMFMGPAVAATLAASMTPDRAEAADGSGGGPREALTNAGVAGTTAAGTGYGISKLAKALGTMGGKALSMGGSMMGPMAAGDMTDMSADEANQGRNWVARNAPRLSEALGGYPKQALDMAQVPERAPSGGDGFATARALQIPQGIPLPQPGGEQPAPAPSPQQNPMMQAAALEVPSDIPPDAAMHAEMEARFSPNVEGRLKRMIALNAPPEAIASFLNQAAAR